MRAYLGTLTPASKQARMLTPSKLLQMGGFAQFNLEFLWPDTRIQNCPGQVLVDVPALVSIEINIQMTFPHGVAPAGE